jgi:ribose transport system ATP-binding protein
VMTLRSLQGRRMQAPVSFVLRRGEILGLAGLVGAGRTETLRTLFGLDEVEAGSWEAFGRPPGGGGPARRIKQGLGFLSEDRQGEGLALDRSVADNLTLSRLGPYSRWGILSLRRQRQAAEEWMARMNIKARSALQPLGNLSGGNQQKTALARLLHQQADILLLDEPTRGIDVVSKSQIYEWIGRLAHQGKSIVFVSSYFPELLGLCDTIAAFHRGRVTDIRPASGWSASSLMAASALGQA